MGETAGTVFVFVAAVVVLLLAGAIAYDVMARRRGSYRSSSEWLDMSRRRKSHFRKGR